MKSPPIPGWKLCLSSVPVMFTLSAVSDCSAHRLPQFHSARVQVFLVPLHLNDLKITREVTMTTLLQYTYCYNYLYYCYHLSFTGSEFINSTLT